MASREVFWNIEFGEVVYIIGAIVIGIVLISFFRRIRLWRLGKPDNRFSDVWIRTREFIKTAIVEGIFHLKILGITPRRLAFQERGFRSLSPKELYPGLAHLFIFSGCMVLLLGSFLDFLSHYFFHFLNGRVYLGFSAVLDSFSILILIGVIMFIVRRYAQRPGRLDNKQEDLIAILLICLVVITGFIVEGFRIAATELNTNPDWAPWSPGGYVLALVFRGLGQSILLDWHRITWWLHMTISFGAIAYVALYWNRLWHMVVSTLNVLFRSLQPKGALVPIDVEVTEALGVTKIQDFTWKQLLDLDACTRCGRCQDICPAYASGKPLNPKKVIQDLKGQLVEKAPYLLKGAAANPGRDFISEVVGVEEIWNCTTCRACQEVCPVYIEHIDKIIEMRRNLVDEGLIGSTASRGLESMNTLGNPWEYPPSARTDWAGRLGVPILKDKPDADIIYWVGCAGSYEPLPQQTSIAMVNILEAAGISYAILGNDELCCGNEARRIGEEGLFQKLAQANIQILKSYGANKIVTACPHCYNTFKNEYTQLGGNFEVVHHSEFLMQLLRQGTLKLAHGLKREVAFHDSCYLGRYNDIYDAPRQVLKSISDLQLVELPSNYERGFCCGGGGGQLWLDTGGGERINYLRFKETEQVRIETIATACPFCKLMLDDAATQADSTNPIIVKDIAEIIMEAK